MVRKRAESRARYYTRLISQKRGWNTSHIYTQPEAKKVLEESQIEQKHFEGVLYNGYFKLMKVKA